MLFQFLIGRLVTIHFRFYYSSIFSFQFLIGRLVTIPLISIIAGMEEFQFLIGRLVTGCADPGAPGGRVVSIPHR